MADDLISRQAAIKAIENMQDCYNGFSDTYDKACIIGVLEEIPTAQPNTPTDTPTDTISRQAAIDALHQWEQEYTWDEYDAKYSPSVVSPSDVIAELPSAQPDTSRIENILYRKSAEEQYNFLWWLMQDYGMQFTDTRSAVIEWLRGERNG